MKYPCYILPALPRAKRIISPSRSTRPCIRGAVPISAIEWSLSPLGSRSDFYYRSTLTCSFILHTPADMRSCGVSHAGRKHQLLHMKTLFQIWGRNHIKNDGTAEGCSVCDLWIYNRLSYPHTVLSCSPARRSVSWSTTLKGILGFVMCLSFLFAFWILVE